MASIPDSLAFPTGFKDGRKGRPNFARDCSPAAREEYERGYAEGEDYARDHPAPVRGRKPKESAMSKPEDNFKRKMYPRGPSFTVHVTHAIMEHARIRDSGHCMIAMAIRDVMPQFTSIAADLQTIRFTDRAQGFRYSYLTPRIAQKALIDFDQGVMPEPFSFRLMGAHVTRMTHKVKSQTPRAMSEAQRDALIKANRVRNGAGIVLDHEGNGEQPRRVGGTLPPMSNFARRREFGLKALRM